MSAVKDAKQGSRSKMWFLTVNNNLEENFDKLKSFECKYKVIGEIEEATTGHKHFHAVLYFNNARNFSALQKRLPGVNLQVGQGTVAQARAYAGKEGIRLEIGEAPHQGIKMSVAEIKKASNEALIENYGKDSLTFIKVKEILNSGIDVNDWHKDIKVFYIFGPSGSGKSTLARNMIEEAGYPQFEEVKYENTFWNGASPGDIKAAIYDDFRDSDLKPQEFIRFIDYNKHVMNIKGGTKRNEYSMIVITSIKSPYEIYKKCKNGDKEPAAQWLRRMTTIQLTAWGQPGKIIPYEPKTSASQTPASNTPVVEEFIKRPPAPQPTIVDDDSSEDPSDPANYREDYMDGVKGLSEASEDFC